MSLNPKGKATARRGKATSKSETAETSNAKESQVMSLSIRDKTSSEAKSGGIQLYQPTALPNNRPVGQDDFTVSQIVSISGDRPIGTSTLHISETYGIVANRPVEASEFEVVAMAGNRPIGSSAMQVSEMFSMSGARPVAVSNLFINEVYSTMGGNRPIASNEIDDSSTLMGFLD
ncbi:MAG: hypothetical protein HC849_00620 [Oscillatoriales cyanobacterium RU_3_3]|nr:hypothetical protein [Microcoleus sp. SM1_3_4]NJM59033.1 hypothetical protein [Oscillatoriales cyanobacterium RU_3_3]NJR24285.1 hypothetical protein [Richelia sp. CSU_2_1]